MTTAYVNRIATAVPDYDVHERFLGFALSLIGEDGRRSALFRRMVERSGIEHRYSCFSATARAEDEAVNAEAFYKRGAFPDTGARMRAFEAHAPALAVAAVEKLDLGPERDHITHLL